MSVTEQRHLCAGSIGAGYPLQISDVRLFLVRTTTSNDDASVATTASGIPSLYDAHPTLTWLNCSNIGWRVVDENAGRLWEITATYSLITAVVPWEQPAVFTWGQNSVSRIIDYDVTTGNPIANSAGQPYDPPVMADRADYTLSIAVNLLTTAFTPQTVISGYVDMVNSTTFFGAAEGYCKCTGIPATSQLYTSPTGTQTEYWQTSFQFAFRNPNGDPW